MSVIDNSNLGTLWNRILGLFSARKINNKSLAKDITINDEDIPSTAVNGETTVEGALGNIADQLSNQSRQIDDVENALSNTVLRGTTHTLSAGGTLNSTITLTGLTENHVVANWGLSTGTVSNPPADIEITEAADAYTVVVSNVTTAFSFTPTFVLPQNLT